MDLTIAERARKPLYDNDHRNRVEICMISSFAPLTESIALTRLIKNTRHPYRLTVYDNRRNEPNTGKVWNYLVGTSRHNFVCIIDSDAFVPTLNGPCWLARLMQALYDCTADVALPMLTRTHSPLQLSDHPETGLTDATQGIWSGTCMLFHTSTLVKYGVFDEEFLGYGPDSEFALRMRYGGGRVVIDRSVLVDHLHGTTHTARADYQADRDYAMALLKKKADERGWAL